LKQLTFAKIGIFVYSGAGPLTLPEITSVDPDCAFILTCTASGPKGDSTVHMCPTNAVDDGKTKALFDPISKSWTFSTVDVRNANYAPGNYTLVFRAT